MENLITLKDLKKIVDLTGINSMLSGDESKVVITDDNGNKLENETKIYRENIKQYRESRNVLTNMLSNEKDGI